MLDNDHLQGDPDVEAPGTPLPVRNQNGEVIQELEQTKRDNCVMLAHAAGGLDNVTKEVVEASPFVITWRDWLYFRTRLVVDERQHREEVIRGVAAIERNTGQHVDFSNIKKAPDGTPYAEIPSERVENPPS